MQLAYPSIHISGCLYIYIYIYIGRERERESLQTNTHFFYMHIDPYIKATRDPFFITIFLIIQVRSRVVLATAAGLGQRHLRVSRMPACTGMGLWGVHLRITVAVSGA